MDPEKQVQLAERHSHFRRFLHRRGIPSAMLVQFQCITPGLHVNPCPCSRVQDSGPLLSLGIHGY